jgi:hypothetical protein
MEFRRSWTGEPDSDSDSPTESSDAAADSTRREPWWRAVPLGAWIGGAGLLLAIFIVALLTMVSGGEEGSSPAAPIVDVTAAEPGDVDPTATQPQVTEPPVTVAPATQPPATEPPATEPPSTTEPPATEPDDPPAAEGPLPAPPFDVSALPVISAVTDPTDDVLPCNSEQVVDGPRPAADLTALVIRDGGDIFVSEVVSAMSFLEAFLTHDSVSRLFTAALSGDVSIYVIVENHLGVHRIGRYDPFTDQMLDDDGTMVWGTPDALVIGVPKQDRDLVEVLVLSFNTPDVNATANGNSCDNIVASFSG